MAEQGMGHVPGEMVDELEKAFSHKFPVRARGAAV
jgi:hypothetical protein